MSFWILVNILCFHMELSQSNGSSQKWNKSVLLKLVVKDWGVRLSFWSNCKSLLGICDSDVETRSHCSNRHGGNTNSPRKKSLSDLEESTVQILLL